MHLGGNPICCAALPLSSLLTDHKSAGDYYMKHGSQQEIISATVYYWYLKHCKEQIQSFPTDRTYIMCRSYFSTCSHLKACTTTYTRQDLPFGFSSMPFSWILFVISILTFTFGLENNKFIIYDSFQMKAVTFSWNAFYHRIH